MKKLFIVVLSVFISFSAFGQIKSVDEYREKKITFYCEEDLKTVVRNINKELSLLESNKSGYSKELYLTLKNFLIVDKLFFSLENNKLPKSVKSDFADVLLDQESICDDYMSGKKYKDLSGDFLHSLGDLKCQMPYVISIARSIPRLTKAIKLYENAVKNDPDSCAALISYALWYDYAPGISGGSHKKAFEIIEKAENKATNTADLFFALMFKGQILNNLKRYDECEAAIMKAHNFYPNETFSKLMEKNLGIKLGFLH